MQVARVKRRARHGEGVQEESWNGKVGSVESAME